MDFDWGEIGKIFSYVIPVIVLILINVFFRKQQEQKRRLTVVKSLLSEIDTAKKHRLASYLAGIRVDRLREPLAKSKQGLEEWFELNKGRKKPAEEGADSTS